MDLFRRDRAHFAPEPLHLVTENPSRRICQTRRIEQMFAAARMDVNGRACLRKPPSRARMIEVDGTKEDKPYLVRRKPGGAQLIGNVLKSRISAGIKKGQPIVSLKRDHRDDAGSAEVERVEDVNHRECEMRNADWKERALNMPHSAIGTPH